MGHNVKECKNFTRLPTEQQRAWVDAVRKDPRQMCDVARENNLRLMTATRAQRMANSVEIVEDSEDEQQEERSQDDSLMEPEEDEVQGDEDHDPREEDGQAAMDEEQPSEADYERDPSVTPEENEEMNGEETSLSPENAPQPMWQELEEYEQEADRVGSSWENARNIGTERRTQH